MAVVRYDNSLVEYLEHGLHLHEPFWLSRVERVAASHWHWMSRSQVHIGGGSLRGTRFLQMKVRQAFRQWPGNQSCFENVWNALSPGLARPVSAAPGS